MAKLLTTVVYKCSVCGCLYQVTVHILTYTCMLAVSIKGTVSACKLTWLPKIHAGRLCLVGWDRSAKTMRAWSGQFIHMVLLLQLHAVWGGQSGGRERRGEERREREPWPIGEFVAIGVVCGMCRWLH